MFDNFRKFGAAVDRLYFVSNQPLVDVVIVHGESDISSAQKKLLDKFVTDLTSEAPDFEHPLHTSLFFFSFSDLNLSNFDDALVGRISKFLDEELKLQIPPRPFALLLNDYCRRRSRSLADVDDFDSLKASKFIARSQVIGWLTHAKEQYERRPDWSSAAHDLSVPYGEKRKIEQAWRTYEVELRERPSAATIALTEKLGTLIEAAGDDAKSLVEHVNAVFPDAKPLVSKWRPNASDHFVKAAILYELKR